MESKNQGCLSNFFCAVPVAVLGVLGVLAFYNIFFEPSVAERKVAVEEKNTPEKKWGYNRQREMVTLSNQYIGGSSRRGHIITDHDLLIPKDLYQCYIDGNILKPAEVAKACNQDINEPINQATVIGYYKLHHTVGWGNDRGVWEIKEITPASLPEIKSLIEARKLDASSIKTSFRQPETETINGMTEGKARNQALRVSVS